jgi:hypothetical protein
MRLRLIAGSILVALALVVWLAGAPARAEVAFERIELSFDEPVSSWLHGDIDRDGDADLLVFHNMGGDGTPRHAVSFVRQHPTGHYDLAGRQRFSLGDSGGVYDLADVAEGPLLELLQITHDGVRYYRFTGEQFEVTPQVLIEPSPGPDVPAVSEPFTWDCAWPLLSGSKESIILPYMHHLEIWSGDESGQYTLAQTATAGTMCRMPQERIAPSFTYELPTILSDVNPTVLELYVRSGKRWHGLRRSGLAELDFAPYISFECDLPESSPLIALGPSFHGGSQMHDLNGDGAPDLIRWRNPGSPNQGSFQAQIYFGPMQSELPERAHAEVSVEGVAGYPEFGDLNGDGRLDMVVCAVEVGPLATAKIFVMKKLKLYLLAFRQRPDNTFSVVPDARLDYDYRMDFDDPRPFDGPLIRFVGDIDGNGTDDLVAQVGGNRMEIYPGDLNELLSDSPQRLDCEGSGAIDAVDLDGDDRLDLFCFHRGRNATHDFTVLLTR